MTHLSNTYDTIFAFHTSHRDSYLFTRLILLKGSGPLVIEPLFMRAQRVPHPIVGASGCAEDLTAPS